MRLTGQSTHRANPTTDDSCPCCFGSLESVKRAMSEVSRALADPLPLLIQAQVGPAVDAVRLSGRDVMAGLRGAFGRFLPAPDLATFRAAVAGLDGAIVVQIRVAEIEDWKDQPAFPDVYSHDFDVYCEYLARNVCFDHAESKNLLGYYLVEFPSWFPHASGRFFPGFEGLEGEAHDKKLFEVATKYFDTIIKHIRRYDPNHLILGDRYNGNKGIPTPVLEAMKPFVDVLSIQYFAGPTEADRETMVNDFARWQAIAGKPVLNADLGNWTATKLNPNRNTGLPSQAARGQDYADSLAALMTQPWFIGWHWCAYVENTGRGWGIKDPWDEPFQGIAGPVSAFNHAIYDRVK